MERSRATAPRALWMALFFGPSREEAAGAFHHNSSDVTGSFGARRLPDVAARLEESGPS